MTIQISKPIWLCVCCSEEFKTEDEAREHEQCCLFHENAWDDSPLNPDNEKCATCAHSSSFLNVYGVYAPGRSTSECPQQMAYEQERAFPCASYARDRRQPTGYDFECVNLPEFSRRYLRSFGISL